MNIRPLRGQSIRPSPVFVALLALTGLGGVLAWRAGADVSAGTGGQGRAGVFVFVIAGWLVSLCLHEFGHAVTAWRFGDRGVEARGYLTLNPLRYSHPMLSLGLPMLFIALGGIGLPGGAVYVQTSLLSPGRRTLVSLAGPSANVLLGVLLLALTRVYADDAHAVLWSGVGFLGFLQVTAVVLNLLPVPGLDGYSALEPHLSPSIQRTLEPVKGWGLLALLVLLISPQLNYWFFSVVFWFFDLAGVPRVLVSWGMALTRFWSTWW